jgi:AbrB family looped-hinge helix DNA binding protein
MLDTTKVGKRGTVVIPAALRPHFGIEEGSLVMIEVRDEGILIRPAVAMPVEIYTPECRAEFLLTNAVDLADYAGFVEEVRKMGRLMRAAATPSSQRHRNRPSPGGAVSSRRARPASSYCPTPAARGLPRWMAPTSRTMHGCCAPPSPPPMSWC